MDTHAPVPVHDPGTAAESAADHRLPNARPPNLPSISDYWPDAPPRHGAPPDRRAEDHSPSPPPHPALDLSEWGLGGRPRLPADIVSPRRGRLRRVLGISVAMLLLAGTAVAGMWLARSPASRSGTVTAPTPLPAARPPVQPAEPPSAAATTARTDNSPPPPEPTTNRSLLTAPSNGHHLRTAPSNGRTTSTFELVSSADTVNLRTAALGADLYRISTPQGGVLPQIKRDGAGVRLFLVRPNNGSFAAVDIVLNSRVRWSLTITGGMQTGVLDLSGTTVTKVDLVGGASRIDLRLPPPHGTTSVRMSGGASQFRIRTPGSVPARVRIRQGAGKVVFNGRTDDGVASNSTFVSPNFDGSTDRIDVDAVAGVGTLTLDR